MRLRPTVASTGVLSLREVRALLGARLTNSLAMTALTTVVAFQAYEMTGDPLSLGWLGLVEAIPALGLALIGGHVADRTDRRRVVLVTSAVLVGCAVLLAVVSGDAVRAGLPAILAVVFIVGTAAGFERPALTAFEAQVIPLRYASTGISWSSTVWTAGAIAGPAVGGVAVAIVGLTWTYAGLAALLAVSTLCVLLIAPKPMPERPPGESVRESLTGGIRFVLHHQVLLAAMALDLFAVFFGGAIAMLPVFASDILGVGPVGLGLLRTAPSIGALVAMLATARRPPTRRAGRILLVCVAGFGVSMIVFGLSTSFLISLAALSWSGVMDGVSVVIRSTIVRVESPEAMRGRVAAVNWIFVGASNELGAFESGVAASFLGVVPSVVLGGAFTLAVVGAVAAAAPRLRELDLSAALRGGDARLEAPPVTGMQAGAEAIGAAGPELAAAPTEQPTG